MGRLYADQLPLRLRTLSAAARWTSGGCLTGWLMLTAAALADGSLLTLSATTWRGWTSIVFGVLGTALAFYLVFAGDCAGSGRPRPRLSSTWVPVFAVLLGALLLDERIAPPC